MNYMEIIEDALRTYGADAQKTMVVEECAELINALAKQRRKRTSDIDIITEIADVQIMLWQMTALYGADAVNMEIAKKMKRLSERLQKHHETAGTDK